MEADDGLIRRTAQTMARLSGGMGASTASHDGNTDFMQALAEAAA